LKGDDGGYSVVIKAKGQPARQPEAFCRVNPAGNKVLEPADARPSLMTPLHCAIYEVRNDVNAVVLGKGVYADTVAQVWGDVPDTCETYWTVGSPIRVLSLESLESAALEALIECVTKQVTDLVKERANAVVIPDFGCITVGLSIEEACDRLRVVESVSRGAYLRRVAVRTGQVPELPAWYRDIISAVKR
jgi:ribulose-5-phosphate 4-epimerase/fuculose-1-phosphate aldolase